MKRSSLITPVTKEAFKHPNEPERIPQIEVQKVLRQPYPEQKDEEEDRRPKEVLVPLAGNIRGISEHIEVQTDKLRDYLDRLEL